MPRKPRWYDAIPEVTATVDCGGESHAVVWRRGKVVLLAHDLDAERTMLIFGGELCRCMKVLEMWVEQFRMPPDLFAQMPSWLGESAYLVPAELALPRRMAMVLSWERLWRKESWLRSKQADLLAAELKDKALAPLRQHVNAWKPRTGARVVSGCQVALLPAPQTPGVDGTTDRVAMRVTARLHGHWLVDVCARGIAVVDDAFVVDLEEALTLDDLKVHAVRWEPNGPGTWATVVAPAHVRRHSGAGGDGEWHLTWGAATIDDQPATTPRSGTAVTPRTAMGDVRKTWVPGGGTA